MATDRKVAIVTAAGRGIGGAILERLAADGFAVAALSPSGAGRRLAESLGGIGVDGSTAQADNLAAVVEAAMKQWGRIDAVVNNTGHPPNGPLLEIDDDAWRAGFELVHLSVVRMARLVTPIMLRQGGGALVNILTYATFEPEADFPVSAPMRAAVAAFAKTYADIHAPRGIRMNNVLPGFVDNFPVSEARRERIPMGRYARAAEIADAVAYLVSERASYITGQSLAVDGGITRSV